MQREQKVSGGAEVLVGAGEGEGEEYGGSFGGGVQEAQFRSRLGRKQRYRAGFPEESQCGASVQLSGRAFQLSAPIHPLIYLFLYSTTSINQFQTATTHSSNILLTYCLCDNNCCLVKSFRDNNCPKALSRLVLNFSTVLVLSFSE